MLKKIRKLFANRRAMRIAFAALSVVALSALMVVPAFAQAVDPLDGAGDSLFTSLTDYLTTKLVPAIVGLAVVGLCIMLLISWGRRAVTAG